MLQVLPDIIEDLSLSRVLESVREAPGLGDLDGRMSLSHLLPVRPRFGLDTGPCDGSNWQMSMEVGGRQCQSLYKVDSDFWSETKNAKRGTRFIKNVERRCTHNPMTKTYNRKTNE